jgi:hypothetical protein
MISHVVHYTVDGKVEKKGMSSTRRASWTSFNLNCDIFAVKKRRSSLLPSQMTLT